MSCFLPPRAPCQQAQLQVHTEPHLATFVHGVSIRCLGIHVSDRLEQQLGDLHALLPGEGGCDVERGQGLQLQRKWGKGETRSAARQARLG